MSEHRPVLLLTRPMAASLRFARMIQAHELGAQIEIVTSPLVEIQTWAPQPLPPAVQAVIFTSANAVAAKGAPTEPTGPQAYCVGERTARKAREAGWQAKALGANAHAFIDAILDAPPKGPLVHIRGRHTRGDIATHLTQAGLICYEQIVYDQVSRPLNQAAKTALLGDAPVIVPLFSPRTAALFAQQCRGHAPVFPLALSQAVALNIGQDAEIATTPTAAAMEKLVLKRIKSLCRVEGT